PDDVGGGRCRRQVAGFLGVDRGPEGVADSPLGHDEAPAQGLEPPAQPPDVDLDQVGVVGEAPDLGEQVLLGHRATPGPGQHGEEPELDGREPGLRPAPHDPPARRVQPDGPSAWYRATCYWAAGPDVVLQGSFSV